MIQQYSYFSLPLLIFLMTAQQSQAWKTGLESGLICYQCVGTHRGCSLYNMDTRWYWGKICPRKDYLNEGKHLYTLDGGDQINAMCFSPNRYWLCAATGPSIKIWDLEGKVIVDELKPDVVASGQGREPPQCLSLAWSADGQTLFAGYSDKLIRVW